MPVGTHVEVKTGFQVEEAILLWWAIEVVPQKPASAEQFRRWWKDVAEYCEDKDSFRFPCCPVLFKMIRGHKNVIESQSEVLELFKAADA